MNRAILINAAVAAGIVALVVAVFVLEGGGAGTPATTTTTSTTTTTTTLPATTTTTSTTTTTTTTTTSSTTSTVPPSTEAPFPRSLFAIVVVNGSTTGERLEPTIDQLLELDYANIRGLVGSVRAQETVIYYAPGGESAADRMRADLDLDIEIAPFEDAPPVAGRNDAQLILYLGNR